MAEREVRSIAYHIKVARFPAYKDLSGSGSGSGFAASEVNEALVRQLHRCEFMSAVENVVLIGGPEPEKAMSRRPLAPRPSNTTASATLLLDR
jgi:IstB-like ATP binding protein